jgi:hypothetical protein
VVAKHGMRVEIAVTIALIYTVLIKTDYSTSGVLKTHREGGILNPTRKLRRRSTQIKNKTMRKRICSDEHFARLLKSFKTMAIKQIHANPHIKQEPSSPSLQFINFANTKGILTAFKRNPYKTCLGFKSDIPKRHEDGDKCWVSYTLERDGRRLKGLNDVTNGDKIVFRYYFKEGSYRKKLYARWSVEVNWIK